MTKADRNARQAMQELLPQVSPEPWVVDEGAADEGCEFRDIDGWADSGGGEWLCLSPADAAFIVRARSLMPALLDWADKAGEWARGLEWSGQNAPTREEEGHIWIGGLRVWPDACKLCGKTKEEGHSPTCPFSSPEFAELFGEEAGPS